jgi:hypothetical protein
MAATVEESTPPDMATAMVLDSGIRAHYLAVSSMGISLTRMDLDSSKKPENG